MAAKPGASPRFLMLQRYAACYRERQQLWRWRGERLRLLRITALPRLCVGLHFQKCFLCAKRPSFFCRCVPRRSRHINDGIFAKLKKTQRVLREIDIQHGGGAAGCLSVGHNKPQSSPFIQIVKLAQSPPEITRISVPTFADLNKSRQGHLIGVE